MVIRIQKLLQSEFHWVISHASRDANQVVDKIIKIASIDVEGVNAVEW